MLDKSMPHMSVFMVNENPVNYPHYTLPEGFTISGYQPGFEREWAQIQVELHQFSEFDAALNMFCHEFMGKPELLPERCLFVLDQNGKVAATGALWFGNHFGCETPIFHWIATRPDCQGKGIIKALLTEILDRHQQLNGGGKIYLLSQTWSVKALNLYAKLGFSAYRGEKPENWEDEQFRENTEKAWTMINEKLMPLGIQL